MPWELVRRLGLAACLCAGLVLVMLTPPALLRVRPMDFAQQLEEEYGERPRPPMMGVMELGREIIRRTTMPASLDEYITRETENRLIEVSGQEWDAFRRQVVAGTGEGTPPPALARRLSEGYLYFRGDEFPLVSIRDGIAAIARNSSLIYLGYTAARPVSYLELWHDDEPRGGDAPRWLIYPARPHGWWWLLAGLGFYVVMPWRRRRPDRLTREPVGSVIALDILGVAVLGVFFALPFLIAQRSQDVVGADIGLTVFFWTLALLGVAFLVWAAANASREIILEPDRVRINTLWTRRACPWGEILAAHPLLRGQTQEGIILQCRDGQSVPICWTGVMDFSHLLDRLRQASIPITAPPPQ